MSNNSLKVGSLYKVKKKFNVTVNKKTKKGFCLVQGTQTHFDCQKGDILFLICTQQGQDISVHMISAINVLTYMKKNKKRYDGREHVFLDSSNNIVTASTLLVDAMPEVYLKEYNE